MIRDEQDALTPLVESRNHRIKSKPCPRCRGNMHPTIMADYVFSPHDPLPKTVGRCVDCSLVLDPQTNLILETGNPANIEDPFKIDVQD